MKNDCPYCPYRRDRHFCPPHVERNQPGIFHPKLYKCDYPLKAPQKPAQRIEPILATLIPKNKSSRFVHGLFQTTMLRRSAGNCYLQLPTLNSMQQKLLHTTYCCAALARSTDVLIHIGTMPSQYGFNPSPKLPSQYGFITEPSWPRQMTAPKWWRS